MDTLAGVTRRGIGYRNEPFLGQAAALCCVGTKPM